MSIEIFLRKRKAREGEMGLFVESQIFDEEWSSLPIGSEVKATLSVAVDAKYRKFFHALCGKLAHGVSWFNDDKDFAKEQLLFQCKHVTYHHDKLRNKTQIKAKTTSNLTADDWIRLLRQATYIAVTEYLPHMEEGELKSEVEQMLGMGPLDLSQPAKNLPANKGAQGDKVKRKEVQADTSSASNGDGAPTGSLPNRGRSESATEETR